MINYNWENIFKDVEKCNISDVEYEKLTNSVSVNKHTLAVCNICKYINDNKLTKTEIDALKDSLKKCAAFYNSHNDNRERHFGFPANMLSRSVIYDFFTEYERYAFLANNCGDTYESSDYLMDSKSVEQELLKLFAEKFALSDNFWGYVTSGGSESNAWGIENAFGTNPGGILYYCQSAHYSVAKTAKHYQNIVIPQMSSTDESINVDILLNTINENLDKPVNLLLTYGTTKYGSCDNVSEIVKRLKDKNLKFYIHLDAALFGGIPNNQVDAPKIENITSLGINSISVSLHKYIGIPVVKSVLLSVEKPQETEVVDYIGQKDSTTSGSRDLFPFSMLQQAKEILTKSNSDDYRRNIVIFQKLLEENNIPYFRAHLSNMFVIDQPSQDVCKKYQLSCFEDIEKKNKAHIIIFPYHTKTSMEDLVGALG